MKRSALLGLIALVPAAFNVAPAAARGMVVPICSGDGVTRTVTVPLPGDPLPGPSDAGCCAKGCHTGSRKKDGSRGLSCDAN
ncbi:MAG: hypothetical protein FP826_14140 [Sphingomonadales bacterium]|nr:hypothetical protein [Sphingomonadales bacterium]MBU3991837.1 hypothetical protein [Alphaproteobacteria bacterium]